MRMEEVLEIKDGLLYQKAMLWILEDGNLNQTILESEHDAKIASHFSQDKTIELIRRNFWWHWMDQCNINYVRSCMECQKNKVAHHHLYGLSSPLELPYTPW